MTAAPVSRVNEVKRSLLIYLACLEARVIKQILNVAERKNRHEDWLHPNDRARAAAIDVNAENRLNMRTPRRTMAKEGGPIFLKAYNPDGMSFSNGNAPFVPHPGRSSHAIRQGRAANSRRGNSSDSGVNRAASIPIGEIRNSATSLENFACGRAANVRVTGISKARSEKVRCRVSSKPPTITAQTR